MTTMQIDRAVVEQALHVAENAGYPLALIKALRAALAQPDPQDPELSAALGWPGGTGDPVLDRTRLLQMVAALRLASQQALEALEFLSLDFFMLDPISPGRESTIKAITALRAALAQQAEPVQEPVAWYFEARHIDSAWGAAVSLKHPGPEGVYMRNVKPLYTAPPQRTMVPLTEEEIYRIHLHLSSTVGSSYKTVARAIEKASWEKNNGQA